MKRVSIRIPTGYFGHIGAFVPGVLRESQLPLPVVLVDDETREKFECNLVHVVPFSTGVPSAFILLSENRLITEEEVLRQHNKTDFNQLAFYTYVASNLKTSD